MVNDKGYIRDRREMLTIKLKSLAAEARIIRQTAKRMPVALREEMTLHRRGVVRHAARHTHLALAFLRGRRYEQIERTCHDEPDWNAVAKMVVRYGHAIGYGSPCYDMREGEKVVAEFVRRWGQQPSTAPEDLPAFADRYASEHLRGHRAPSGWVGPETMPDFLKRIEALEQAA